MVTELTPEEKYIYDESPEISVGEAAGWTRHFFSVFPAFASRNYQLYFAGQLISLTGTWLQIVAQGWLVLKLTNSAFLIGLVAAVAGLPTLLFALFGGVIVDRFPKRKILLFTQASSMILAFVLGILTVLGVIRVWEIAFLAFLLGTVNALDAPARLAFVVEMVGKKKLPSAIALNSGIFNSARVIGPSLAGFLIVSFGVGGAFILNGISYLAVIAALLFIKVNAPTFKTHLHPLRAIGEGLSYAAAHPIIRSLLLFTGVSSIFGWSYTTMMPLVAQNTFHAGAGGLGYLYAAAGVGALTATVLVSALAKKVGPSVFIIGGNALFALAIFGFTFTSNLLAAFPFLFLAGLGLLSQFSMMNTTIQNLVEDRYRGRIMSLYTIMFMGLFPVGNLQIGLISEHFGWQFAVRLGAAIVFLFGLLIFWNQKKMTVSNP